MVTAEPAPHAPAAPLPGPWPALLEDVRRYPSPHNSQPIAVRVLDEHDAEIYYDLDRGLPAEDLGIPFGHVCAGVFLESLAVAAAGHGYAVRESLREDDLDVTDAVVCLFGGEGISEGTRAHMLRTARSVVGAYGASDLEISIAVETGFTIALRGAVAADPALSATLTRQGELGVLPNIVQYNPYAYVIEENAAGELVVTITRPHNLSPRLRYNTRRSAPARGAPNPRSGSTPTAPGLRRRRPQTQERVRPAPRRDGGRGGGHRPPGRRRAVGHG